MAPAGDPLELRFKTSAGTAQVGDSFHSGVEQSTPLILRVRLLRGAPRCHAFAPSDCGWRYYRERYVQEVPRPNAARRRSFAVCNTFTLRAGRFLPARFT